jgi:hypothetical protein
MANQTVFRLYRYVMRTLKNKMRLFNLTLEGLRHVIQRVCVCVKCPLLLVISYLTAKLKLILVFNMREIFSFEIQK